MVSRSLLCALVVASAAAFMAPPAPLGSTAVSIRQPTTTVVSMAGRQGGPRGFKKLALPADQRKALLRSLTTECIRHGRITTTFVRAKEASKHVDHMIQLSKRGDLHARRQAMAWMYDKQLVHALFDSAADRYADRNGGYTRVLRTMPRSGDNAKMGILELV